MNGRVMLFALVSLALLSGCATRRAEYVDYHESGVVVGVPGYYWSEYRYPGYWFEYRRPVVYLAPHVSRHPSMSRPFVPRDAGRHRLNGGHMSKPEVRPPRGGRDRGDGRDRRAPSATFHRQGTGGTNAAPAFSRQGQRAAPRPSGAGRASGGSRLGGRGRVAR
ncbi:MAG: hypothetical protein LBF51_03250 [Zoogloeaceae bacterium]|nr:hypothetical protein [Zoogloeaceae bacterium]